MRSIPGLLSLLLLLLPCVGGAQEAWGRQPALSRSLLALEDNIGVATEARDPFATRVTGEVLLGSLAGAGGALAGGLVGLVIADAVTCGVDECLDGVGYVGGGIVTGIALAAPIGVYFAGRMMGGNGLFLPTLAGSLASGGLTALTLSAMSRSISPVGVLLLALSPLVGSIIGYEVSHAFVGQRGQSAAGGLQVLPTAGVTRAGTGVFGLAGRF
ncbi:MAG: hypothetical protein JXB05_38770 [Myxococcaceae bacterium]|nr:hypothetical protein [Myxococcaceae bacterium]